MKIGLITGEFPPMPGGVGDFSRILAERWVAQGHDVHILSRRGSASEMLPITTVKGWGPGSLAQIRAWLRKCEADVVNLQFQTAAYNMSPVIHFLPIVISRPLIVTFHDLRFPYLFPKAGPLRDWIVMHLARSSAGVITTNQEDAQQLKSLPRQRLIPIGSSILSQPSSRKRQSNLRLKLGIDDDTFLLGHFGFINEIKGVDYLINALSKLRTAGRDLRLVFIGGRRNAVDVDKDWPYLRQLEARIRRLNLEAAVHWTGYLPDHDVASAFDSVDLMALPYNDGASYRRSSLMAAIHQGCAILTTEPAVTVATFLHRCNLWLVPRQSADEIEQAISLLMDDRAQLSQLREGAAKLRAQFDWNVIARDTVAFFETCM